jgi:hypothetical protein
MDANMKIRGICCSYDEDLDKEVIEKDGIEFEKDVSIKYEYYNEPRNIIGKILEISKNDNGVYFEGELFDNNEIVKIFKKIGKKEIEQKFYPAIGGKILERNGNNIEKVKVDCIALVEFPVDTNTWFKIVEENVSGN